MAKIKKLIFWIFLLIHPFCGYFIFNFFHRLHNSVVKNSTDYDALVFTQSWPKAVCSKWKKESPSNTCLLPAHDNWTIHGIWPTFLNDEGPNYCESSVEFDVAEVASIEEQLLIKWPDVLNKTDEADYFQFWKHEWDKHATCSINHPHLNSIIKYFQTGLDLADKYDITRILNNANIQPGKSYDIQEILDKLFFVWGRRSRVTCFRDKKKGKSYLLEISVCLDKGFRLIDCDNVGVGQLTNCKSQLPVIYIDDQELKK